MKRRRFVIHFKGSMIETAAIVPDAQRKQR